MHPERYYGHVVPLLIGSNLSRASTLLAPRIPSIFGCWRPSGSASRAPTLSLCYRVLRPSCIIFMLFFGQTPHFPSRRAFSGNIRLSMAVEQWQLFPLLCIHSSCVPHDWLSLAFTPSGRCLKPVLKSPTTVASLASCYPLADTPLPRLIY